MSLIIFTNLDILLPPLEEQNYESVISVIQELKHKNIPLILITDNTRAEITSLSQKIGLNDPLIVEQGSGIFIPQDNHLLITSETTKVDDYHLYQLGCTYTEARAALKAVQEEIGKILRGFGDLDEEDIQPLIGSSLAMARRAKAREFSEYFLTPNRIAIQELRQVATEYGFKIIFGDRLSLIMGQGADPKKAVQWLIQNYQTVSQDKLTPVGLGQIDGNVAEALDTLTLVDVPKNQDWQTDFISAWVKSIRQICQDYHD
ncbi:mannosyl-3-phosphoglycerate phosphatase [Pleurocapsa sp. PCC 7319]|uniref:HAD-IIB family hydrolase n=1 Tax=Pleurocapsa sp. PCC 7319 TaxID=118161 RepID=UPI000349AA8E|nr:hypothetical protein [Pleurocapsa sp. PCC 7319]